MAAALCLLTAMGVCAELAADNDMNAGADSSIESAFDGLEELLLARGAESERGSAFATFGGLQLSGELPARWYAGDSGRRPTQKYQGNYGTCWALTAVSALEAAVLPGQRAAFSADHMANRNAYTVDVDAGGSYQMVMAYLSGWQGPVTEAEDPYGSSRRRGSTARCRPRCI